jgi:hypothetical protein
MRMELGTANTLAVREYREKGPDDARWLEGKTEWARMLNKLHVDSRLVYFLTYTYRASRDLLTTFEIQTDSSLPTFIILRV